VRQTKPATRQFSAYVKNYHMVCWLVCVKTKRTVDWDGGMSVNCTAGLFAEAGNDWLWYH